MNTTLLGLRSRLAPLNGLLMLLFLISTLPLAAQSLDELRQRQKADQKRLLDYYDNQALKECPKGPDGKINTSSPEYKKLLNDYKRAHRKLNEVYRKKDPRLADLQTESPGLKNSGSTPKNLESDVDWTAETDEAFQKKKKQWEARGDKLEVEGHKVVNKTTDETLWEPGTKAGDDALVKDGDAHGTEGGRKDVAGGNNVSDSEGSNLDRKKKHLDAKKRGNLKDQSKVAVKGAEEHGRSNRTIDQAKEYKNYGDSVTSGVSDLGDDAETRQQKEKEFGKKVEAEVDRNVTEGTRKGKQADEIRKKIEDSAKQAENSSGNKEWDEAKKKANYGDQKTTSEAIEERRKRVEESNRKTREEIDRQKKVQDTDTKKSGTGDKPKTNVEAEAPETKTKVEPDTPNAKTDAPETKPRVETEAPETKTKVEPDAPKTRTNVPEAKPKVEVDAPKTKMDVPETPKTKVAAPDGPKIKVEGPKVGDAAKKVVGDGLDAIDIFSTAEDVKKDIKDGNFAEGAKKAGEAVLDEVTVGGYSGAKTIHEKKKDLEGKDQDISDTNQNLKAQHDQNLRVELRRAGMTKDEVNNIKTTDGLEHALRKRGREVPEAPVEVQFVNKGDKAVEQVKKQISEEHKGNMRDQLVKSGKMTREEAEKLNTEAGLEHAMKKNELKIPEKRESGFIEVDDTLDERIEQVGEGIKTNVKKAGTFVKQTGEDLGEIGVGLTEDGVARQAYENSKENAKGWLETWEEERKSEKFTGDNKEGMIDYLEKRGASPVGAKKAADDFYDKGDTTKLENLDDTLRYKDAVAEAKRRGEEIPSKEEFDKVSKSLKSKKERRKAEKEALEEPGSPEGTEHKDDDQSEDSVNPDKEDGKESQIETESKPKDPDSTKPEETGDSERTDGGKTEDEGDGQQVETPNPGEENSDETGTGLSGEEAEDKTDTGTGESSGTKRSPRPKQVTEPERPDEDADEEPGPPDPEPDPSGEDTEDETDYEPPSDLWDADAGETSTGEEGGTTTVKGWVEGADGSRIVITETRDADGNLIETSDVEIDAQGNETGRTTYEGGTGEGLKEGEAGNQGDWEDQENGGSSGRILDDFAQQNSQSRQQETESGYEGMQIQQEMDEASHAGDDDRRQAKTERNQAGEDAADSQTDSNRVVTQGDRENSWGKTLGDALEDGLTTGLKTAGQEFGNAAAEEVIDEIWKPEPPPPPPRTASGPSGSSSGSGGGVPRSGTVAQGGGNGGTPSGGQPTGGGGGVPVDPDSLENEPGTWDQDAMEHEDGISVPEPGMDDTDPNEDDSSWMPGIFERKCKSCGSFQQVGEGSDGRNTLVCSKCGKVETGPGTKKNTSPQKAKPKPSPNQPCPGDNKPWPQSILDDANRRKEQGLRPKNASLGEVLGEYTCPVCGDSHFYK